MTYRTYWFATDFTIRYFPHWFMNTLDRIELAHLWEMFSPAERTRWSWHDFKTIRTLVQRMGVGARRSVGYLYQHKTPHLLHA